MDITKSLTLQKMDAVQIERVEKLRAYARNLGTEITKECWDSREKSLALTKLEECVMWAVKSIALEE